MISIAVLILTIVTYWIFFVPCNWKKRLTDVGYDQFVMKDLKINNTDRRDVINRLRRSRATGNNEMPPPYPNGWYSILESSELARGQSKYISCLGEHLVIYRTIENKVFTLDAYCPHLGANLGVGGRVIADTIECPFHKWSFRGSDGKCVNIPYSSSNKIPFTNVRSWKTQEVNGNIFIWYHTDPEEIVWELPFVKEIDNGEFVYHGRNEFYINCHIQEIPENGSDIAHFSAIHKASLFAGGSNPDGSLLSNAGTHCWTATWFPDNVKKHVANISLTHMIEITEKIHMFEMAVTGIQIGPSYVQLHMKSPTLGRIIVLQTVTPIEPLVQKVIHRFYAPRILAPLIKFIIFGESVMFERDIKMWNHKTYRSNPKLVKEDGAIKAFRKWYNQFYSANSKSFLEARETISW